MKWHYLLEPMTIFAWLANLGPSKRFCDLVRIRKYEITQESTRVRTKQDFIELGSRKMRKGGRNWSVRDNSTDWGADRVPKRSSQHVFKHKPHNHLCQVIMIIFHHSNFRDWGLSLCGSSNSQPIKFICSLWLETSTIWGNRRITSYFAGYFYCLLRKLVRY